MSDGDTQPARAPLKPAASLRYGDPIRNLLLAVICGLTSPTAVAIALGMTDTELEEVLRRKRPPSEFELSAITQLVSDYRLEITGVNDRWRKRMKGRVAQRRSQTSAETG